MEKFQDGLEAYQETRLYKPKDPVMEPREKLAVAIQGNKDAIRAIENHLARLESNTPGMIGSPYYQQLINARNEIASENLIYTEIMSCGTDEMACDAEMARQLQEELNLGPGPLPMPGYTGPSSRPPAAMSFPKVWTNLELTKPEYQNISMCEDKVTSLPDGIGLHSLSNYDWKAVFQPVPPSGQHKRLNIKPYLEMLIKYHAFVPELFIYSEKRGRLIGMRWKGASVPVTSTELLPKIRQFAEEYAAQCRADATVVRLDLYNMEALGLRDAPEHNKVAMVTMEHVVKEGNIRYVKIHPDPRLWHVDFQIQVY